MRRTTTDELTRSTRMAANAAALAVLAFAALWVATTQVSSIREVSPFADDPWDAVASYAAIFLPVVAGATWIRSLRNRGHLLADVTAARIRWGVGLALGIVLASVGADLMALATVAIPDPLADQLVTLIVLLVAIAGFAALVATALLVRAGIVARQALNVRTNSLTASTEPDIVDDLLALAADVARPIGLSGPFGRLSGAIDGFLERSSLSPRRHPIGFGVLLSLAAAVGFDIWHAVVEGGWGSPAALLAFGVLAGVGVLGIYLGTVVPLRLLRPPGRI
jgi:hypothetical protein